MKKYRPVPDIPFICKVPEKIAGAVFSYKLRYIVGIRLVEMAISTNQKPTIYRNLYENTGPVRQHLIINGFLEEHQSAYIEQLTAQGPPCSECPMIWKVPWTGTRQSSLSCWIFRLYLTQWCSPSVYHHHAANCPERQDKVPERCRWNTDVYRVWSISSWCPWRSHSKTACCNELRMWMARWMLKLNDDKTDMVIFMSKYHLQKYRLSSMAVGNSTIMPVACVRDLGVQLDQHLNKDQQVTNVCKACRPFVGLFSARAFKADTK